VTYDWMLMICVCLFACDLPHPWRWKAEASDGAAGIKTKAGAVG
jgi:hypothetical protein